MIESISVVIICKNAAVTIEETLQSLRSFSDVVVYDNGSTDDTCFIVERFDNVSLHKGEFLGFGPTKAHAVSLATNDWVLSLDADEQLTQELVNYLSSEWTPDSESMVGTIIRHNYLMGKRVAVGGWGDDWLVRLFNRKKHQFNDAPVHEEVPLTDNSEPIKIAFPIRHNAVQNIGQFLLKIERYSEIRRTQNRKIKSPFQTVLRSGWAFIKSYFLQRGFTAGWRGLVIAWNASNGVFYKYMKAYVDRNP